MKRDMALVMTILEYVENANSTHVDRDQMIEELSKGPTYAKGEVDYNTTLCEDKELVSGHASVGLTWEGHDFLAKQRIPPTPAKSPTPGQPKLVHRTARINAGEVGFLPHEWSANINDPGNASCTCIHCGAKWKPELQNVICRFRNLTAKEQQKAENG